MLLIIIIIVIRNHPNSDLLKSCKKVIRVKLLLKPNDSVKTFYIAPDDVNESGTEIRTEK